VQPTFQLSASSAFPSDYNLFGYFYRGKILIIRNVLGSCYTERSLHTKTAAYPDSNEHLEDISEPPVTHSAIRLSKFLWTKLVVPIKTWINAEYWTLNLSSGWVTSRSEISEEVSMVNTLYTSYRVFLWQNIDFVMLPVATRVHIWCYVTSSLISSCYLHVTVIWPAHILTNRMCWRKISNDIVVDVESPIWFLLSIFARQLKIVIHMIGPKWNLWNKTFDADYT